MQYNVNTLVSANCNLHFIPNTDNTLFNTLLGDNAFLSS